LHTWDMSDKYTTYPQLVPGLRIHGAWHPHISCLSGGSLGKKEGCFVHSLRRSKMLGLGQAGSDLTPCSAMCEATTELRELRGCLDVVLIEKLSVAKLLK
jgi:hypothetical protein